MSDETDNSTEALGTPQQSSVELGQSSKGDWYVKSVKVYCDNPEELESKLFAYVKAACTVTNAKNTGAYQ